jgi:fatty acid desaturase
LYERTFGFCFIEMEKIALKKPLDITIWLRALAGDYLLIAVAFLMAARWGWPAYPFSLLILGIAHHRLAVLGHEGAHGVICRNKKLNYWLAQVFCFWPLLVDIKGYRDFHWEHHKHTGEENVDPELELKHDRYKLPISRSRLWGRFFLDLLGASTPEFVETVAYVSKRGSLLWPISFLVIFGPLSYFLGHFDLFVLFMLAKPTTFWAVFRLRIYIEHVGIPETHRVHLSLWQRLLFAPHNIWIHWEHHKHPFVPYYQLPDIREKYKDVPVLTFYELLFRTNVSTSVPVTKKKATVAVPTQQGIKIPAKADAAGVNP